MSLLKRRPTGQGTPFLYRKLLNLARNKVFLPEYPYSKEYEHALPQIVYQGTGIPALVMVVTPAPLLHERWLEQAHSSILPPDGCLVNREHSVPGWSSVRGH